MLKKTASATMMLTFPPATKRKILDLSRCARGKRLESGMLLPIINGETLPGTIEWGGPDHIELKPQETLEAYGMVHTHPGGEEEEQGFSQTDWANMFVHDRMLFVALATPKEHALVLAKIKPVHPEMKERLKKVGQIFFALGMFGLSILNNTPDEIMEFMETQNLTFFTKHCKEAGISLLDLHELYDDLLATLRSHTIYLNDERPNYFKVMIPGIAPESKETNRR